jgi:cation diffusion facilitator family transporter
MEQTMDHAIHETGTAFAGHHHDSHSHTHGVVDQHLMTTERGLHALKWSFAVLAIGATLQTAVVMMSGSVALAADAIHNAADAATAIPLGLAFILMRRKATDRFTYGYGRVEDLAGLVVVLVVLLSAIAAAYEAVSRLVHPHPVEALGAVAAAGVIGFTANEAAAYMRIRTGKEIHSAALIADGEHARVDGLTSLAVAAGAGAIKLGYPIADPIIAIAISIAIFGVVREAATTVFTRLLDGVEPGLVAEIRAMGRRMQGIRDVFHVRARWIGHRLHAEADIAVDPMLSVAEGIEIADRFKAEVMHHVEGIHAMHVGIRAPEGRAA